MRRHDETWADGDDASKPSTSKNRQDKDTELSLATTPSFEFANSSKHVSDRCDFIH